MPSSVQWGHETPCRAVSKRPLGFQLTKEQAEQAAENLNLARREAWRFQRRTDMAYDDLESVAFIGLMKACSRFEPDLGWKFSTFAVPKIRGELLHYVRDHSYLLRLSHRMRETWIKGRRFLDRGHSDLEVAKELDIPLEEWLDTRQACSGAPLELKDTVVAEGSELKASEDSRLEKLERAVEKAWHRIGAPFAKNLSAHYRFDHLLRDHAAETFVATAECIHEGRDVCFVDLGVPAVPVRYREIQSVSVEQGPTGELVIHAHDLGGGRIQHSFFESGLSGA